MIEFSKIRAVLKIAERESYESSLLIANLKCCGNCGHRLACPDTETMKPNGYCRRWAFDMLESQDRENLFPEKDWNGENATVYEYKKENK